jgi:putative nucleotidyltransferase with HDIG domain
MGSSEENKLLESAIPDKIRAKMSSFPSMPQAAVKLRALLKEKDIPLREIEDILRHDPGLATNVLRLANSAYFGLSTTVGSLKQAVMLLGVKRFAQIAVSAGMSNTLDKAVEGYNLPAGKLWLHSIAVSNIAEALAKNRKIAETDDVFTPALVHDMGKLVLGPFIKHESKQIENIVSQGVPLVLAEHMVLGVDHAEIGALILAKWSLPSDIVDAVCWHHNPERIKNPTMQTDIVYLSNLMCQLDAGSDPDHRQITTPSPIVLKRMGIKSDQYNKMAEKARSWMSKLSENLTFD